MRLIPSILVLCGTLALGARPALAQGAAGTRTTPDGKQVLNSKDVASERSATSMNLVHITMTGKVF